MLPYLYIASAGDKGRGVYTSKAIAKGTIIETSPVLILTAKERKTIEETKLFHYVFEWGDSKKLAALGMGYISMYNHDYSSNCEYEMDFEKKIMSIKTVKAIKKGEELTINYNADPNDKTTVWFHK